MPAHIELQLISKLVEEAEMRVLVEEGITLSTFGNTEARMLFECILKYYQDRGTRNIVPDRDWIQENFPSVDFPEPSNRFNTRALCIEVKKSWLRRRLADLLIDAEDNLESEPFDTLTELTQGLKELALTTGRSRDVILGDSIEEEKSRYLMAQNSTGYEGIAYPMGWGYHTNSGRPKILKKTGRQDHPLNEKTRGKQKGEFILLYGRPKSMKSWLLVDMAVEDYSYNNCRTLIFTKEMSPEQLRTRFVARMLCVDYEDFKNGELPEAQEKEFFELVKYLKEDEQRSKGKRNSLLITTGLTGNSVDGLASLEAKIEEFEPDVVYADSVYRMQAPVKRSQRPMWQEMGDIAYGLKGIAQDKHIPIVATSQANRKGEETRGGTLSEIAFGDSFGQACDIAMRIILRELEDGHSELACIIAGGREFKLPGFLLKVELAKKVELVQIFESSRQIQALMRAEEAAMAREEQLAADKILKDGRVGENKGSWK